MCTQPTRRTTRVPRCRLFNHCFILPLLEGSLCILPEGLRGSGSRDAIARRASRAPPTSLRCGETGQQGNADLTDQSTEGAVRPAGQGGQRLPETAVHDSRRAQHRARTRR